MNKGLLQCSIHKIDLNPTGGCSAHESNWYCPLCEKEKEKMSAPSLEEVSGDFKSCEANKIQVAGKHYKSAIQHWDYVIANDLNYFEAQITKYATRCRKKNGIEDLRKCRHFLEKYIECYDEILSETGEANSAYTDQG